MSSHGGSRHCEVIIGSNASLLWEYCGKKFSAFATEIFFIRRELTAFELLSIWRMHRRKSEKLRSRIMAAVPSKNNRSTEQKLKRLLRANKLKGWRTQWPVKGTPDFAWPKLRVAVFVDGCFWHGCWRCYKLPKTRRAYWRAKHRANKLRDRRVDRRLRGLGWKVLRIRECQLKIRSKADLVVLKLILLLKY